MNDDDILPELSEEVCNEKLSQIADLISELFPCTEGWSYELNLENAESGTQTGIIHDPHDLFDEYDDAGTGDDLN